MLLGGVGGTEAQLVRDFGARRRHTGIGDEALNEAQDLCLARGKIGHFRLPVYIYSYCNYIQISARGKRVSVPAPVRMCPRITVL